MEFTRQDWVMEMQAEAKAAFRFAEKAENLIKENRYSEADKVLDFAIMAKRCAMQAHEAFWELENNDITEEELEAVALAEQAQYKVRVALNHWQKR